MHLSTPSTPAVCYENADNKLAHQGGTFFGTRDRFRGRQKFLHGPRLGVGGGGGWERWSGDDSSAITFIVHLIFIIIASAPPQTIWHYILQVRDPWIRFLPGRRKDLYIITVEAKPPKKWWVPDPSLYHKAFPTQKHTHTHTHTHTSLPFSQLFSTLYLQTKIIRNSRKDPTLTENTNNRLKKES